MKAQFEHHQESLELIREMIDRSRKTFERNSFYFLLWGLLMLVAGIVEYILIKSSFSHFWIGWPVLSALGGIVTAIYSMRREQKRAGASFTDSVMGYAWMAYGISLLCIIFAAVAVNENPSTFVLLLTGLPTFFTGFILRHTPLKLGGLVFWIAGIASIFAPGESVSLIFSTAILLGYLIPGYTLMKSEKQSV